MFLHAVLTFNYDRDILYIVDRFRSLDNRQSGDRQDGQ